MTQMYEAYVHTEPRLSLIHSKHIQWRKIEFSARDLIYKRDTIFSDETRSVLLYVFSEKSIPQNKRLL
jgi:hypothetical protein